MMNKSSPLKHLWSKHAFYSHLTANALEPVCCKKQQKKSSWPVTGLWNRGPLKIKLTRGITLVGIIQVLQRSLIPQTSSWSGTFFAVSYSKPALGRQETGELEEVQRCLPKPTAGDKSDSFHKNTPCPLSCCIHSKGTKALGYVCFFL